MQTAGLGEYTTAVAQAIDALKQQQLLRRLWDRDAALWSSDSEVAAAIRNRLGWLRIADVMAGNVDKINAASAEIRKAGFTHALLLGMGGSGLFSEVCRYTFGVAKGHLQLTVLDTTDPTWIKAAAEQCPLKNLLVIISSKSGATSEISALSKYFYDRFKSLEGDPGSHCVVITDSGTALEEQAKAWRCRQVFVHGTGTGADVGGRFSALTFFGLVPSALMGVDIQTLLERAAAMYGQCGPEAESKDNPAVILGAALAVLSLKGRDKMTLLCSPQLSSFGTWVEQLIAENMGKQGKGVVPIFGEPVKTASGYGSDRVFVELQLSSQVDNAVRQQAKALGQARHPVISIEWKDRYDLGAEVAKWAVASAVCGAILKINPFDEPNVKESKDRTKALLSRYCTDKKFPDEKASAGEGQITLYNGKLGKAESLSAAMARLLKSVTPQDYLTVLSFLPRTEVLDRAMHQLRQALSSHFPNATLIGFGPRYLHSTGQLFKGGPNTGVFLLLTGDDPVDLLIPGEPFSFSILKHAQALGDYQAMQEKGRRLLRLHLRGDLEAGLKQVLDAIEGACA